ncbi:MAG: hypothetical protein KC656_06115 [Myxococcales bacterium]|nr:hypothetical protein [Myxococcales bacterium]
MRSVIPVGATLALFVLGCGNLGGEPTTPSDPADPDTPTTPEDPAAPVPTTLAEVSPEYGTIGPADAAPSKLTVRFARDVIEPGSVGPLGGESAIAIEPALAGTWTWSSPSRLTFEPAEGFAPDTTYTVRLEKLQSRWGPLAGQPVLHTLQVPPFELSRVSRAVLNKAYVDIDVVFTGPVAAGADNALSLRAGGVSLRKSVVDSGKPDRVRLRVDRAALPQGELDIEVRLANGAKSRIDASKAAPATTRELTIDTTVRPMEVRAVRMKEGDDGFYVEVICHDAAAGDEEYWWDRSDYESYYVSERCMLARDALASLRFEPEVENVYVAEGQRGFRVFGDFARGDYTMTLGEGAFTEDGGILQKAHTTSLTVEGRTPRVELVGRQGRYLPRGAWGNLPVRHLNTDTVKVSIRHVPAQNLVYWLADDDEDTGERTSDLVAVHEVKVKNPTDRLESTWIDVAGLVKGEKDGLFEIRVDPVVPEPEPVEELELDTGMSWRRRQRQQEKKGKGDVSRIVITDLHLVAKESGRAPDAPWASKITAFALDADSGQGVAGVVVDAVRPSGFVMATCRTGLDGACDLDLPDTSAAVDRTPPVALVARKNDDLTYLKFADLQTPVSEDDVAGIPWTTKSPYTASVYADRGVYRPGDTVHFGMLVRDASHAAAEAGLPAMLTIQDPRRKVTKTAALSLDANGLATFDLPLAAFAPTGSWRATLEIGGEEVETHPFAVEEFVPERMKVEASLVGEGLLATEAGKVDVNARYLFGGSAEGSPVEVTCSIQPRPFVPKNNKSFHYGPVWVGSDTAPVETRVSQAESKLDADGEATVACGGSEDGFPASGRLVADVAVFEGGSGRASRASASVPVHPDTFYIGLDTGVKKAGKGDRIDVSGILVDWDGNPAKAADEVELVFYRLEEEYGWWWWDDRGESSYDLYLRRSEEKRTRVKVGADGKIAASFVPMADGAGYLVRAVAGNTRTDLRIEGGRRRYAWSSGNRVDRTPRPGKPTSLDVKVADTIQVGAQATARVVAPYDGRMLFTVETDRLIAYEWVDVKAGEVSWTYTVPGFVPNVYVSAFLVKDPHLDSPEGYTPERAFGVSSVRVDPAERTLAMKLGVPDEVRSNSPLKVDVDLGKAGASASITVAAVDEGILQLTKFQSPDPLKDVFAQRELGIRTYETVGWSMLVPAGPSSTHGGDGSGAGGRVQPVKPVALWSGVITADASGKASVVLDVPQYRGKLRVMAVASSKERMGSADASVFVRDPLVLQTTLPRFLVQGDQFQVPVFVTNMSGKDRDIEVSLKVSDLPWPGMPADPSRPAPVSFLGADRTTVRVKNGESRTVAFQARSIALVGAAKFEVRVAADTLESWETLEVPFAPAAPKERTIQQITLTNGKLDLDAQLTGWLPTTEQSTFWVTPNPYAQAMGHLKHLVRYPYGCIEQTTSSTRPLLFVRDLVPNVLPELVDEEIDKMVKHGVDRVLSMQTPSGGFGYWPGSREPSTWGTIYATHMLLDARAQKHEVPQDRIDDAIGYLELVVKQSSTNDRAFSRYRNDEAYAHYVLAMAGKPQKARATELLARLGAMPTGQDAESAYLLKAALYKAGDRTHESSLRKPDASTLTGERKNSWSFYSDLRRRGMTLSVYHDLFGAGDPGAEDLAKLVAAGLATQSSRWYTTQELVWGVTGLGKRVAAGSHDFKNIELLDGGKPLDRDGNRKGKDAEPRWAVPRASERDLELKVGDAGSGKLYLIVNSEGVKTNAVLNTGGSGLALTRTYHDAEGNPVDLASIDLGDVVYTKVDVKNTGREEVQNIALVDRFVSGWEIENPRLGRSGAIDWVDTDTLWEADYMNLRDDRVELFGTLGAGDTKSIVYAVRAVTAGEFTSPPVEAEAMYDPTIWARQPGPKVIVKGPWEDVLL